MPPSERWRGLPGDAVSDPALREAANQIANGIIFLERDERLTAYELVKRPHFAASDRSFNSFEAALQRAARPKLPDSTQIYYNQGFIDLELVFRSAPGFAFSMRVLFGRGLAQRTATYITFIRPDASVRAFRIHDDTPLVHLDPSAAQAAWVLHRILPIPRRARSSLVRDCPCPAVSSRPRCCWTRSPPSPSATRLR